MSEHGAPATVADDRAPGDHRQDVGRAVLNYAIGLVLAAGLTGISFWVAGANVFWGPGVAIGLCVLAIAQMGIHLVFFLHLSTGPDNTNNALAVAFGVLIIVLVGAGSLWIMSNLNANMMPTEEMTDIHMQH
jgi:cytochrome o ubiquinol oxidase subunit IV